MHSDYVVWFDWQVVEVQAGSRDASRPSSAGGGGGTTDVGSEIATGTGEGLSEDEDLLQGEGLSDISETGWDTDLDIEGQLFYTIELLSGKVHPMFLLQRRRRCLIQVDRKIIRKAVKCLGSYQCHISYAVCKRTNPLLTSAIITLEQKG